MTDKSECCENCSMFDGGYCFSFDCRVGSSGRDMSCYIKPIPDKPVEGKPEGGTNEPAKQ